MEEEISMQFLYEGWIWCRRQFHMQFLWFKRCYNFMTHRYIANLTLPKEVFLYAEEMDFLQDNVMSFLK